MTSDEVVRSPIHAVVQRRKYAQQLARSWIAELERLANNSEESNHATHLDDDRRE